MRYADPNWRTRPLVHWPDARLAPRDVLERLREIDPTAELVHLGAGYWLVGSVQPNEWRRFKAARVVAHQFALPEARRSPGIVLAYSLYAQGFRPVAMYTEREIQSGLAIWDFRERDYNWRNCAEETVAARLREAEGEIVTANRIAALLDHVRSEWPSIHRFIFRGARSFRQPGVPWRN
jgi:hypothetical protein